MTHIWYVRAANGCGSLQILAHSLLLLKKVRYQAAVEAIAYTVIRKALAVQCRPAKALAMTIKLRYSTR